MPRLLRTSKNWNIWIIDYNATQKMKSLLIVILLLLITAQAHPTTSPTAHDTPEPKATTKRGKFLLSIKRPKVSIFFNSHYSGAEMLKNEFGIPMQISLAQFALESGFGKSDLCLNNLNFGGIKHKGAYVCYESKKAFYLAYAAVFSQCCYEGIDRNNVDAWLVALERCGYATSNVYVKKLKQIIETYKLYLI